jgi:hypothetical protein
MPPTVAEVPTAIHAAGPGFHGRRRSVSQPARKTKALSAMPVPICTFQNG